MCADPVTLAIIGTAVSAIGTGVTAVQAYSQQKYQQKVAEQNAKLEDAAARDALDRGKQQVQQQQRELSKEMGAQRASMAANGIDVAFGSAADFRGDTAMLGQEDAQTIRENNIREVMGFERQAGNYRAKAQAAGQAASGALVSGAFGVANTLLGGAQQYSKLKADGY
ncbi:MAG TPA: hypothetical protein VJM09_02255 [Sphingobium sp.]|nr:hypothetical protein [Sphingobium sp.]